MIKHNDEDDDILESPFATDEWTLNEGIHEMRVIDGLRLIPDASVDCIMFDGPYFISDGNSNSGKDVWGKGAKVTHFGAWDIGGPDDLRDELVECARIMKISASMFVFSGFEVLPIFRVMLKEIGVHYKRPIVWAKNTSHPLMSGYGWTQCTEHGLWCTRSPRWDEHVFRKLGPVRNWVQAPRVRKGRMHDCQKNEDVYHYFMREVLRPGDVVVEPYAGSAPAASVAKILQARYYGFDFNHDIVRKARELREV